MKHEQQVISWLEQDEMRMDALRIAQQVGLNDWCIGAGFVRNLIWDKLHGYAHTTSLNDLDLIYFDPVNISVEADERIEKELTSHSVLPWSVKNQARMHCRNNDAPYRSTCHAMSYWVELETAIGARLSSLGQVELVAPFGVDVLFRKNITMNPDRLKPIDFDQRINSKRWLQLWPDLTVVRPKIKV
ncbi:hypothetical protein MSP8887_00362 [Marinomonas spartinae]|uniref:Nitrate reductase n=1 Tax=Marinomonas spartinae TaxID=1792290 RepID=A0A1A8TGJ4_9GAMM|nr:nucleotidyltransferase family protein [Marinomonas spartinae]SBS26237.1 hypothetical protein MSP8887_00362 [Marinomonas spartinae]SBS32594.1 hypothetical protein MSP8886_02487 [Marinomonas spartinae]